MTNRFNRMVGALTGKGEDRGHNGNGHEMGLDEPRDIPMDDRPIRQYPDMEAALARTLEAEDFGGRKKAMPVPQAIEYDPATDADKDSRKIADEISYLERELEAGIRVLEQAKEHIARKKQVLTQRLDDEKAEELRMHAERLEELEERRSLTRGENHEDDSRKNDHRDPPGSSGAGPDGSAGPGRNVGTGSTDAPVPGPGAGPQGSQNGAPALSAG